MSWPSLTLALPPLTQLNTPYPSTAYLARFLRDQGVTCAQRDLGIELVRRLFTRDGLDALFDRIAERDELPDPAWRALALRDQHCAVIEPVMAFLSGADRSLGPRILGTATLPAGPRVQAARLDGFGPLAVDDAARHLATLYVADLADLIASCEDPGFGLARYQHHLAVGSQSFDGLWDRLHQTTWVDAHLDALADTLTTDVVGLSVPFPGNLYGALRVGRRLRARGVTVWMGGGFVNTELRDVDEPRLWQCVDALTYDDGESPLLALLDHHRGGPDRRHRTRTAQGMHTADVPRPPMTCAAWYGDLDLSPYLNLVDGKNPAHRLWADGRWNKITVAHGCYWKRCAFCDVSLDYIARYERAGTERLVDAMADLVADTGQAGFHLVDEAAPPAALQSLATELLHRGLQVTWWGNIRFERSYTPDVCRLLAASGCVAVTGGLEVASDRLLERMNKGVTVEQVARAAAAFQDAGVMVHAYLMYGFPTQTLQETVDSMELVRQLFETGALSSAFWHRFVATQHSPVGADPAAYGVRLEPLEPDAFGVNDRVHVDPTGADPDRFDDVLPQALAAWMLGEQLDRPVHTWFPDGAPPTTEPPDRIARALHTPQPQGRTLLWTGAEPLLGQGVLVCHHADGTVFVEGSEPGLDALADLLDAARPGGEPIAADELNTLCRAYPDLRGVPGLSDAGLLRV